MSSVDNLLGLHKDVLCNVILDSLPRPSLYRFSRVSKACLEAVGEMAKLPQFEISLTARISLLKEKEEKEELGAFPFTNIDDLCTTIKWIGKKNRIVFDSEKIVITLEEKEGEVPLEEQTVTALLYRRLKVETLLRHRELLKALPKDTDPSILEKLRFPTNRTLEVLNYSFGYESPYLNGCYPLMVLFDLSVKNYSEAKLGRAMLTAISDVNLMPELSFNIVNAIFCHPHAKDLSLESLATALIKSIGEKSEAKRSCNLGRGGLNGKAARSLHILEYHVVPPDEMLKEGETKNLTIPRLIFSHPKAPRMNIREQIENMLLSAVRYRALDLVQKILAHEDADNLSDDVLVIARDEAKSAEEHEIAKAIESFLDKLVEQENNSVCTVS